jgi:hypothetical protein
MPNLVKKLARQELATSEGTLYTTPSATSTVVTNIVLTNTTASAITGTIKLGTHEVLSSVSVAANGILALDLRQVLEANEIIAGVASSAGLKAHISGTEVS